MGVICGYVGCGSVLNTSSSGGGGGHLFFPNLRGGLVPYPPPLSLLQNLSDMRALDSGFQHTMDGGVGCFTEGVIDDDP